MFRVPWRCWTRNRSRARTRSFLFSLRVTDEEAIRAHFSNDNAAVKILRDEISREYTDVATAPHRGYHFNTGRDALEMNGYEEDWLAGVPETSIASFSGMGNPFSLGMPVDGEYSI